MLHVPFFQIVSANKLTEKIHEVNSFSNWTVDLRHCTEYKKNIEIHDIWREALVKANDKFLRIKHNCWDMLTQSKIMITQLLKEQNLLIITTQISSLTHMCLSWALWTEWQVTETKNVALFILKNFADYHFIIILSCCNCYSQKLKSIWIIALTSSSSTKRSKYWERSFETSC